MSRARRRWRLTLVGAIGVAIVAATGAVAYFTSHGTGTGFASTGSLSAPTLSATPGAGTVGLSWTTVIPPTGSDPVTYYVMRDGVDAGGSCPASASPTGVTSCADSGLSAGTYQYTVTAKWHSWTATSNVQTVTLASGALDHFLVTPATGTQTAGTPFSVTVTAKDAANNTVSAYAGAIHFASNDGRAVVPGGYTFTTGAGGDNGVHAFTNGVTLKTAGTGKTVTVADGSATGTAAYTVGPGAATQIVLSGSTADLVSGSTRTFTATIEDAYGNTSDSGPDSGASVDFEQTGGAGSVSGTGASLASAGVVSKTVTGKIAGSVTIRATATLSGSGATGSNILAFTVDAGPAAQLVFGPQPAGATGGTAFTTQPVVTARDAAGNVATSYAATVSLSIKTGTGTAGATLSGCTRSLGGGVTSFTGCKIDKSGTGYQLHASDGGLSAESATFTVGVGAAVKLAFTTSPGNSTANTPFASQPVVNVQDAGGNTVATDSSSVTLAITNGTGTGGAAFSCTTNPKSASAGVVTFAGCKIDKAGTGYSLTATDGSLTSALSGSFDIAPGAATSLVLGAATTTPTAGAADPLTITAKDSGGNTATSYTGPKSLSFGGPGVAPDGTNPTVTNGSGAAVNFGGATTVTFTNGVATVTGSTNGVMTLYRAETANVTVTDGSINNGTGLSVTVSPAARVGIILTSITTQPTPAFTVAGAVGTTLTYTSSGESNMTAATATARISLADLYRNPVTNTGSGITLDLAANGDGSVSAAALTIANGTSESSGSFTLTRNNGNKKTVTLTVTVHGTSQTLTVTMSS